MMNNTASYTDDVPASRREHADRGRSVVVIVATMALLIGVATGVGHLLGDSTAIDRNVSDRFAAHRTSFFNGVTNLLSQIGSTLPVIAIAVLVIIIGLVIKRRKGLIVLAIGMIGEVLMFLAIAALVSRARPTVTHLDSAPPTSSFPSGHVFATTVLWGAIAIVACRSSWPAWLRYCFAVLAFLMPVFVALSRLYRGMHHLTDVTASAVLGVIWLFVLVHVLPARDEVLPQRSSESVEDARAVA
jgi:undecaprenyl-diphosphatase